MRLEDMGIDRANFNLPRHPDGRELIEDFYRKPEQELPLYLGPEDEDEEDDDGDNDDYNPARILDEDD